jgi:hypothetical protein
MSTVAILPSSDDNGHKIYRAIAGEHEAIGSTAGAALDALTEKLADTPSSQLLVLQSFSPDWLFTVEQQHRLADLMEQWRYARDRDQTLPIAQQAELDTLVEAELKAATARSLAMMQKVS